MSLFLQIFGILLTSVITFSLMIGLGYGFIWFATIKSNPNKMSALVKIIMIIIMGVVEIAILSAGIAIATSFVLKG